MICSFMPELQPLFEFDPLLLRVYIKKTAVVDLKNLVGKVPTDILLMRLAEDNLHKIQVNMCCIHFIHRTAFICLPGLSACLPAYND